MDPGYGIRDPGSRKNLCRIPDSGVKGTGSRIRIRNTARYAVFFVVLWIGIVLIPIRIRIPPFYFVADLDLKFTCLPEPEPKLRIVAHHAPATAPAPLYLLKT
jgi:hypothetical protein